MVEPPRPRLSGRAPVLLACAVFAAAVAAFALVLVMLQVLPSPVPLAEEQPTTPSPSPTASAMPDPARFAKPGDCVMNIGDADRPNMIMVTCAPQSLEVIERLEGTFDHTLCEKIEGYQFHYFYDSETGDKLDFVLCLRKRDG